MKICIVTSEVTYIKKNYQGFIESLIDELSPHKDEVELYLVMLKNRSFVYFLKSWVLFFLGAKHFAIDFFMNNLNAFFRPTDFIKSYKIHFFNSPNDEFFINFIKNHHIDLVVNTRTRFIYKRKILKLPRFGCINIHHGLLPENRGTMCDLHALNLNKDVGFTIHVMNKKIDDGEIIQKEVTLAAPIKYPISYSDQLYRSSIIEGKVLANLIIYLIENNKLPKSEKNINKEIQYFKNPSWKEIRKMKSKGIIL